MSILTLSIYSNDDLHTQLYQGKTEKKYILDIEKMLNSPKWKEIDNSLIRIECDSNTQFYCRTISEYIYIVVCDLNYATKIHELIDKIHNFVLTNSIKNFNSYSKNFDELLDEVSSSNNIVKIKNQIKEITDTMTDTIATTIERQDKINNLEGMTNNLLNSSASFGNTASRLKRNMWCRNIKMSLIIGFIIAFVIGVFILILTL
jgi:vesicle-associated membrane protein 4